MSLSVTLTPADVSNPPSRNPTITRFTVENLHGNQNYSVELRPGLNIVEGKNGSGKTTFLHILANLIDLDIARFCYLNFKSISVSVDNNCTIRLTKSEDPKERTVRVSIDGDQIDTVVFDGELQPSSKKLLSEKLGGRPVYLPAFRSILEATPPVRRSGYYAESEVGRNEVERITTREMHSYAGSTQLTGIDRYGTERAQLVAQKTLMCRDWFGKFVPIIRFPSLAEISDEVAKELNMAHLEVAATDRRALSSVFVQVLHAALGKTSAAGKDVIPLLADVQKYLANLEQVHADASAEYSQIAELFRATPSTDWSASPWMLNILEVYERALSNRATAQEKAFHRLRIFQRSVNQFLENKSLGYFDDTNTGRRYRPYITISGKGMTTSSLSVLSSGERHVLSLVFAATHMSSKDGILLIDEPELSLHVDWQRIILSEIMKQSGSRQIITCSHAPEVSADHLDSVIRLKPTASEKPQQVSELSEES